jgi:hypothetical protein
MRRLKVLAFISCLLLTTTLAAAANISGRVTFRGSPLAGALVTANLIGKQGAASVTVARTDAQGGFLLQGLGNGEYILFVDMDGRRVFQGKVDLTGSSLVKNIDLQ